ncbi:MAG TPA: AAA family ATPase [Sedimentisphaerales bacterium]|nr:AAA family ATPase [Sedimentisphaerales bacterium]
MLTRLRVSGFKNLVDADVRFGPFTCIAGPNGVGKSNLFDAIRFLSDLADRPLAEAALAIRGDENGKRLSDIRSLFWRCGDQREYTMSFDAEMIVPASGQDDLGERAEATTTFLQYSLVLAYRKDDSLTSVGSIEILKEQLTYIKKADAHERLGFDPKVSWRNSAVQGRRSGKDYISTEQVAEGHIIKLHQDGRHGRPLSRLATNLPRTVLSATNAAESPTALLARREMRSWRLLQLEPSALRRPDEFSAPTKLGSNGSHLAATLYRLAHQNGDSVTNAENTTVCAQVANRLAELIENVRTVSIDRDEKRELLTVYVTGADRTAHAARSLSDGTLRFLALAVLEQDPEVQGVLCLEEPENGIHPARIPAMIRLLQDIATDTSEPVGPDNPLRQVIVNTHSPSVFLQVPADSVLMALPAEIIHAGARFGGVRFCCIPDTWRSRAPESHTCTKGDFLPYLSPVLPNDSDSISSMPASQESIERRPQRKRERVVDLLQTWFHGFQPESSDQHD